MYLTFEEFRNHGGETDRITFDRRVYRAQKIIDLETHSRVKAMRNVPEAVKRAMTELIMIDVNSDVLRGEGAVKSFSTDGYSETIDAMTVEKVNIARSNVLVEFLAEETDDNGTPLLYMGVDV